MRRIFENKKSKNAERTLAVSVLALVLCCGALFGAAYAWMTDIVSHDVATIQAGTLEVDLVDALENGKSFIIKEGADRAESTVPLVFTKVAAGDGAQTAAETEESGQTAADSGQAVAEESITVWDIGETYQLPVMYVVNKGTTDLTYTVSVEGISDIKLDENNTTVNLADLIDFTIQINDSEAVIGTSASGTLQISDDPNTAEINESAPDTVIISGKLKEGVNASSYQGKEFSGITVKIDAGQTNAVQTVQ